MLGLRASGLYNARLFRFYRPFRSTTGSEDSNNMVTIRLSRGGSKKRPFYNIVVADSRDRRDGRFIERIGFYNPVASGNAEKLRINQERLAYWKSVGAQPSDTVARIVRSDVSVAAAA
jgi:small subunit ribosomal protein S16